jgi:hypothetical protein
MGGGTSKFSLLPSQKITSEGELKMKMDEVTQMANSLFFFMFKSSRPDHEAFDIANEPEKYVTALSELIHKQFTTIGYSTTRTASGEIYFQRYEKLNPQRLTGQASDEHKKNCKIIAFYFVRIYQILGSMLLIIKDADLERGPTRSPDQYADAREQYIGKRLPKIYYNQQGGVQTGGVQTGGGTRVSREEYVGPLEFLKTSLSVVDAQERAELSKLVPLDNNKTVYSVSSTDLYIEVMPYTNGITKDDINKNNPLTFIVLLRDANENIRAYKNELKIIQTLPLQLDSQTKLQFISFKLKSKSAQERRVYSDEKDNNEHLISVTLETGKSELDRGYIVDITNKSDDYVAIQSDLINYYRSKTANRSPKFVLNTLLLKDAMKTDRTFYKQKTPMGEIRDVDTESEEFSEYKSGDRTIKGSDIKNPVIGEIFGELQKGRRDVIDGVTTSTFSSGRHCIKRAIQLLNPKAIFNEQSTEANYTRICKFSAPDSIDPQVPFDKYVPTKTFAQLFGKININPEQFQESAGILSAFIGIDKSPVDGRTLTVDDIERVESRKVVKKETDNLKEALVRLKEAFKLLNEPTTGDQPKSFGEIMMKKPKECATIEAKSIKDRSGGIVVQNDNMVRQLRGVAQELLAYHVRYAIEISKFLKSMFNIEKDPGGTWLVKGIKESFLIAGFSALDSVTDIARDLILDYYEGCEKKYQQGVKMWVDEASTAATPAAAAAAASLDPSAASVPSVAVVDPSLARVI